MMTQDRTHGLATSTVPRNLNPTAPAFCQSPATPASPQNLNPTAPAFQHSPTGDKPTPDPSTYLAPELGLQALISNGDISVTGTNLLVANTSGILREAGSQSHRMQHMQAAQGLSKGFALALNPQLAASAQSNHQPGVVAAAATSAGQQQAVVTAHQQQQQQQQIAYAMSVPDSMGGSQVQQHQVSASNPSSASLGAGEFYENPPNGSLGVGGEEDSTEQTEDVGTTLGGQDFKYPDEILAPIRKQMQFYFSSENLPSDKFLNQHMDSDKYIPLELFLDFGRIKPICSSIDLLTKAVESSSVLELSDDRKRVRVSQCRKTLTLRGFPQSATEEDVRQFILEMGAYTPTHIEFVMFKERYSVWYVSFKDEAAALNSFFQFHNQKAVYKDHTIGCCIKSSGTLAAAGYFPSMEESNQRRLAYQNQAAVAAAAAAAAASIPAPVHSVQNTIPQQPQPQPQPPQALMQSFSTMQLHSYVPSSPASIYYQQTPQGAYMPYMTSMIQGWPGPATAMEPGLIMQNNGLQPQHIRTSMPRTHIMPTGTATQHRFNRPQRGRQGNLDRGSSERPNDRPSIVAISGLSRSSPHSAESGVSALVVPQGAYVSRQTSLSEDMSPTVIATQPHVVSHQFVTPLVAQQPQPHAITPAGVSPSSLDHVAVRHYQPSVHHQHQHPVVVQAAASAAMLPPTTPQLSSPLPASQQQQMPTHHIQPPPKIPQQQQQNNHQHQHQQPPMQQQAHYQHQQQHFQQQQAGHLLPHHTSHHHNNSQQHHHSGPHHHHQQQQQQQQQQHHHNQPPPPQTSHHPYQPHNPHHHQQQPHSMSPHHHQHPHHPHPQPQQQQHQFIPPPQVQHYHHQHHQQSPPNGRSEKRNRRKRDDDGRNQRPDRGQSSRASYGSQVSVDNFTIEANSFPPLTGALQSSLISSEVSQENRVSDLVWGMSRNSATSSSTTQHSASPVHAHLPISGATAASQHHGLSASAIVDPYAGDDRDSLLDDNDDDDDSASSSQGDADVDVDSLETRSVRSEPQPMASVVEPLAFPSQSRSQKSSTPVASPVTVSAPRQMDGRHGLSYQQQPPTAHLGHHQQQPHQHASAVTVSAAFLASDVPRPSYAQILAQKNRESTSNVGGDSIQAGGMPQNSSPGAVNGPNLVQNDSVSAVNYAGGRSFTQSANAFREHGNYHGGQQHGQRSSSQRGPPKDGLRYEGAQQFSQQMNSGRRNSKENRISSKFDRRKHDTHLK